VFLSPRSQPAVRITADRVGFVVMVAVVVVLRNTVFKASREFFISFELEFELTFSLSGDAAAFSWLAPCRCRSSR